MVEKRSVGKASSSRWLYYLLCFLAIVILESFPRFLSELNLQPSFAQHFTLLVVLFVLVWFFFHADHEKMPWSVLSGLFVVDAVTVVVLTLLMFLQLFSPLWIFVSIVVIVARAGIWSYAISHRLTHMRGLVFFMCLALLVAGELIIAHAFVIS